MNKSKYHNHKKVFLIFTTLSLIVGLSYFYAAEKRRIQLNNMVKYHTKMVKSGSISSLVELGKMYEKGEGVKKDLTKAQELFKKAINFNKYIDEIYPSYSNNESGEVDSDNISKKEIQLNKVITNVKFTEQENQKSNSIVHKKQQPKYVPYNRKKSNKNTTSNKSVALIDTSKNNKKIATVRKIKNTNTKKITKKSKTFRRKKKNKSNLISYKKSAIVIKKPKKTITKKPKLQAKRSPTLYEARPDYETELGIFEDEELEDNDDEVVIPVKSNTDKKQTIGSNFTSNPCASASAKYIAKCRRANRRK